jgi:hypothetical protein
MSQTETNEASEIMGVVPIQGEDTAVLEKNTSKSLSTIL